MGFYDNWNFDGLKFFSQLKTHPSIAIPCDEFLTIIKYLKNEYPPTQSITVAEIGIGYGATALQVLKLLGKDDVYYCFDFADRFEDFISDLKTRDYGIKCQIVTAGNTHNEWDSYNWNLSNMIFRMRERHEAGIFDAVYLDGAHTLLHDGLAVCLLKELIKVGGFLILDDLFWIFSSDGETGSNTKYASGRLTKEQMDDCQILRVQELFLSNDPNFEKLSPPQAYRGIFRKRS